MTQEELWELFPIVLTPHQRQWGDNAKKEIALLSQLLYDYTPAINHIGSTAIPDIHAKPIIDILIEISPDTDWLPIKNMMETNGYICMSYSDRRMSFNKGYTPEGYADNVFHIHFHPIEDNDEICFRDYLITHPDIAKEYERLKLGLLPEYKHNRDGYTKAKTEFIKMVVNLAKGVK